MKFFLEVTDQSLIYTVHLFCLFVTSLIRKMTPHEIWTKSTNNTSCKASILELFSKPEESGLAFTKGVVLTQQLITFSQKIIRQNWSLALTHFIFPHSRVCNTDTEYRKPVLSLIPNTGIEIQGIPVFQSPKYGKFWVKFTSNL